MTFRSKPDFDTYRELTAQMRTARGDDAARIMNRIEQIKGRNGGKPPANHLGFLKDYTSLVNGSNEDLEMIVVAPNIRDALGQVEDMLELNEDFEGQEWSIASIREK